MQKGPGLELAFTPSKPQPSWGAKELPFFHHPTQAYVPLRMQTSQPWVSRSCLSLHNTPKCKCDASPGAQVQLSSLSSILTQK